MPQPQAQPKGSAGIDPSVAALANSASDQGGGDQSSAADDADRDYAMQQGWVPKDKYTGPEERFVDFKDYADRARNIVPIINERNRKLEKQLEVANSRLDQMAKDTKEALRMQRAVDKGIFDTEIAKLRGQRAQAIKDGDGDAVNTIDDKIDAEKEKRTKSEAEAKANETPTLDKALVAQLDAASAEFQKDNPWILDNNDRRARLAFVLSQDLLKSRPELARTPDFYPTLAKEMRKEYPEMFKDEKTRTLTDGGGSNDRSTDNSGGGKKTIKDLPKDARETAKRYAANGWIDSEQRYVDNYFADKAAKESRANG